jgi:hypothetical protein
LCRGILPRCGGRSQGRPSPVVTAWLPARDTRRCSAALRRPVWVSFDQSLVGGRRIGRFDQWDGSVGFERRGVPFCPSASHARTHARTRTHTRTHMHTHTHAHTTTHAHARTHARTRARARSAQWRRRPSGAPSAPARQRPLPSSLTLSPPPAKVLVRPSVKRAV